MDKIAILKKAVKILLVLGLAGCLFLFLINLYMIRKEKPNIISADDAAALEDVDCIMVLGCSVRPDGTPSGMLRDRLDKGIELYEDGVSDRLLMSGDHGRKNYDEVNMYRALYVAQAMGMEAYGVESDPRQYGGQKMRDLRELLARPKDLIYTIVMPKPTYLGDAIPVSGDGNVTNDKEENRARNKSGQK